MKGGCEEPTSAERVCRRSKHELLGITFNEEGPETKNDLGNTGSKGLRETEEGWDGK